MNRTDPYARAPADVWLAGVRAFVAGEVATRAAEMDRQQQVPPEVFEGLAVRGMFGAQIRGEYGGVECDAMTCGELCEIVGAASGSLLSLVVVHGMVATALSRWGSPQQRERWLPAMARGELIAAFALTELLAGSNVQGVETVFVARGDHLIVSGVKTWVSFARKAGVFLVVGKLEGRLCALLVEAHTPGVTVEPIDDMLGFRAAMLGEVRFAECVVPRTHLIAGNELALAQIVGSILDHGRYCIGWGCVGIATACITSSQRYAEQRSQFGRPLAEHQLVARMLADMQVEARAARLLCIDAARARTQGLPEQILLASMAKYFAAGVAERAASAAVQIHGANGCSDRYPVQRYYRDARVMSIIEGSDEILQLMIAREAPLLPLHTPGVA